MTPSGRLLLRLARPTAWAVGLLLCLKLAEAQVGGAHCKAITDASEVLSQLNALRAKGAVCGKTAMPGASALRWDERLANSAQGYALELAQRDQIDRLSHSVLRERLRAVGYRLRLAGENLAAGPDQLDDVLALWLVSPEHCANLLEPRFADIGLACVPGRASAEPFWVLHLGRSLQE